MRKIQIAIGLSSDLCNRLTWNLTGSCVRPATETSWAVSYGGKTIPRWRTAAILKIDISSYLSEKLSDFDEILYTAASSVTTGGNGGSCLRAPLERGRRVQTAMFFFILFNYNTLLKLYTQVYNYSMKSQQSRLRTCKNTQTVTVGDNATIYS